MKKRIAAWVILVVMLVAAVPAAWAAAIGQVEDFGVEREGAVITVTPPEGYAEKGYYKLFWKNEETGEIKSEVFPADTRQRMLQVLHPCTSLKQTVLQMQVYIGIGLKVLRLLGTDVVVGLRQQHITLNAAAQGYLVILLRRYQNAGQQEYRSE